MARNIFGLDIGTSNIKIYSKDKDYILNEKNIIAIANKTEIFAFGDEAFEMHEKAPDNIKVSFPIKNGVIADFDNMQTLFIEFIKKMTKQSRRLPSADYYIAVPTGITEVEKRAFLELIDHMSVHAKRIMVINKPVADAIGAGVDVVGAKGIMIVNIGADTTEISVLSLGGIVLGKSVKFGGNKLDEQIINAVKKEYRLVIGAKTAEYIKCELGSAIRQAESFVEVYGRHVVTGLPTKCRISSNIVYECIIDFINQIVDSIKSILERTPPELSADIIDTGIYLTGGSTAIRELDTLINNQTDLHVNIVDNPSECVVNGIREIIENDKYSEIAYVPKTRIIN
ncbi:MAG: rod shape-determining protein [Butyrivibrio sp.]|nr:rod shape-determining protein [Butyrivibrio sp.]